MKLSIINDSFSSVRDRANTKQTSLDFSNIFNCHETFWDIKSEFLTSALEVFFGSLREKDVWFTLAVQSGKKILFCQFHDQAEASFEVKFKQGKSRNLTNNSPLVKLFNRSDLFKKWFGDADFVVASNEKVHQLRIISGR